MQYTFGPRGIKCEITFLSKVKYPTLTLAVYTNPSTRYPANITSVLGSRDLGFPNEEGESYNELVSCNRSQVIHIYYRFSF